MRSGKLYLGKKSALCAASLIVTILCIVFSLHVYAAEENGIPQLLSAKLYTEMSDNSNIIANLIVGNEFEIVSEQLDGSGSRWYKVQTDFGAEGYAKAGEIDKLIVDAHEMMYSAAIASANAEQEQASEGDPDEGDSAPEEDSEDHSDPAPTNDNTTTTSPDTVQTGEQTPDTTSVGEQQAPDAVQTGEQTPDDEPVQPENDGEDLAGEELANGTDLPAEDNDPAEMVPASSIADQAEMASLASGAGFGEVDNTDTGINNDGFTVIERTDQPKKQLHSKIDVVLIMIIAGGILCIMAIAALLMRILTCVRTKA